MRRNLRACTYATQVDQDNEQEDESHTTKPETEAEKAAAERFNVMEEDFDVMKEDTEEQMEPQRRFSFRGEAVSLDEERQKENKSR